MASILDKLFGKKPEVPELPQIRPGDVQKDAISENLAALPQAEALAGQASAANIRNLLQSLEMSMPGAFGQARQNVGAQLRGEIPTDVSQQVQRISAETGLNLGIAGGQLGRNLTARDLGLTSLNLQQQGLSNFASLSQPFLGSSMDATSMFFSPSQRLNFAVGERAAQFQTEFLRNQISAAPDPGLRGVFDTTMEIVGMVLSAYGGGSGFKGVQNHTPESGQQKQQSQDGGGGGGKKFFGLF